MALTIAIEGKGVIANCDALVNDTGGTGTGDWSNSGGGASHSVNPDVYLYGSSSIGMLFSNKAGIEWFVLGPGNELDFTTGTGSESGQFIYMWINIQSAGQFNTLANHGLCIRLADSTGLAYMDYLIAGSDGANGWTGGWKLFVIDPMKAPSRSNGTLSTIRADIHYIGLWIHTTSSVKAESIFLDQIAVGSGLRITGTSVIGWKDVVDYCTDYPNRAWGMFQQIEGIYYAFGKMCIGSISQSANVSFKDSDRIIKFGTSQYYESSAWKTSFAAAGSGIVIEDHASYTTTFEDGVAVGTDGGRAGSILVGNADQNVSLDLYGGNNAASVTKLYATSLKGCTGSLIMGNDSDHLFYAGSVSKCSQFNSVGAPKLRNLTFAETIDIDAALLWNESIDIQKCSFIANTLGAGIEMPSAVGTPYAYNELLFSGNTKDVYNSSGSAISINKNNGSNPTTSEGATVTFLGVSVTTEFTLIDSITKNAIQDTAVFVKASDGTGPLPFEATVTITRVTTVATVAHTAHGLATGNKVEIEGSDQNEYNRIKTITVTGVDAYTYYVSGTPTTPATGTITSTGVLISGDTDINGQISDTRAFASNQPFIGSAKKGTSDPVYVSASLSGTVDKDNGLEIIVPLVND